MYPAGYNINMKYRLKTTRHFDKWFAGIKDKQNKNRVLLRLNNMTIGYFGDHKQVSGNLFELRMFFGPGFRVYYTISGRKIIFLLAGGDKSTQRRDIAGAKELFEKLED